MNEKTTNSMLYFIVGGLLVAVIIVGYFTMNSSNNTRTDTVIIDAVKDTGSSLKLDVDKDGGVSGSINTK